MRVHVLGSGAGGGFPQWNCNCRNCAGLRSRSIRARARTQSSIALSADGERWYLANASPDIRAQLESFPALHPRNRARHTPIEGIFLTNADVDHVAGLLSLRESQPLKIHATPTVREWVLGSNTIFSVLSLSPNQSRWQTISLSGSHPVMGIDGSRSGLSVEAFPVAGKPPGYLRILTGPEDATIGLRFIDDRSGHSLAYVPGVRQVDAHLEQMLARCDCILFDGTCWTDDEMIAQGVGQKTALAMGHLPIGVAGGSLAALPKKADRRQIYIHINNTNPILNEDSAERVEVERAGWEVAFDGMDFDV